MEDNDTEVFVPHKTKKEPGLNLNSLLLFLILLTLVAFGAFYFGKSKREIVEPIPLETVQPEITFTPSPEASVSATPSERSTIVPETTPQE